jgi:hypothetical protein
MDAQLSDRVWVSFGNAAYLDRGHDPAETSSGCVEQIVFLVGPKN